jgi:hypothetical protein
LSEPIDQPKVSVSEESVSNRGSILAFDALAQQKSETDQNPVLTSRTRLRRRHTIRFLLLPKLSLTPSADQACASETLSPDQPPTAEILPVRTKCRHRNFQELSCSQNLINNQSRLKTRKLNLNLTS